MSRNRPMLSTLQSLRGNSGGTMYDPCACSGAWRGLEIDEDYSSQARNSRERKYYSFVPELPPPPEELVSTLNNNNPSSKSANSTSCEPPPDVEEESGEDYIDKLPDHLLMEILVRVRTSDWIAAACVRKRWADMFAGDGLWQTALIRRWPSSGSAKRWPGPIGRGSTRRYVDIVSILFPLVFRIINQLILSFKILCGASFFPWKHHQVVSLLESD